MLTITLPKLMSNVQLAQMKPNGSLDKSGEARHLKKSLEEMEDQRMNTQLINDCGLLGMRHFLKIQQIIFGPSQRSNIYQTVFFWPLIHPQTCNVGMIYNC